jgi:hypothetical protein
VEYTSLMICFLLHELSTAETLLRIVGSFGDKWFPVTVGYTVTRAMFETDVTGHYLTPLDGLTANHFITLDSSEWAASRYRGYPTRDKGGRF